MSDNMINVNPHERQKFAQKLIDFEEDMKNVLQSMKNRLDTASGLLRDEGSQFYIAEANNMVEELEQLMNGSLSDIGGEHLGKALKQQELKDRFAGQMGKA